MPSLPSLPLFPDPQREGCFEESADACGVCGKVRGYMHVHGHYSSSPDTDDLRVCPWCIADGSAAKRGMTFNDGTIYPAFDSTPQLSDADRGLVEQRTPGFETWQGNHWLMCCARACIYLGEAEAGELLGRWAAAVPTLWNDEEPGWAEEDKEGFVARIKRGGSPAVYVFKCQVCGGLKAYWDCD